MASAACEDSGGKAMTGYSRTCKWCKKPFTTAYRNKVFCSRECRLAKMREQAEKYRRKNEHLGED